MSGSLGPILSNLIILLCIVANLLFIWLMGRSRRSWAVKLTFILFNLALSLWLVTLLWYYQATSLALLNLLGKANFASVPLFLLCMYLFVQAFPKAPVTTRRALAIGVLLANGATLVLVLCTPWISQREVFTAAGTRETIFGPLYALYLVDFAISLTGIVVVLAGKYHRLHGVKRTQVLYLMLGVALGGIVGGVMDVVLPYFFGIFSLQALGALGSVIVIATFYLTVIRSRFVELRLVLATIGLYVALGAANFLVLSVGTRLENTLVPQAVGTSDLAVVNLLLSGIYVVLLLKGAQALTGWITTTIAYHRYDPIAARDHFLHVSNTELSMRDLFSAFSAELETAFAPDALALYAPQDPDAFSISPADWPHAAACRAVLGTVTVPAGVLLVEELPERELAHRLTALGFAVVATTGRVRVLLGEKASRASYSIGDLVLIQNLLDVLDAGIARALLSRQIVTFNQQLQSRVEAATASLHEENTRLEQAYRDLDEKARLERDMLDIMGHELRTPATVVKLASYMLARRLSDPEGQQQVARITESIERLIRLINTFINTAKLDNQKLDLVLQPVHLDDLVRRAVDDLQPDAAAKDLALTYEDHGPTPPVLADSARIREVIDNLISNAIKYTTTGHVKAWAFVGDGEVVVKVEDSGEGIRAEDQGQLFQKFKRLNNYTASSADATAQMVRPGGTGLGLYVARGVIELHHGKIWVDSVYGQGSTFGFALPVASTDQLQQQTDSGTGPAHSSANLFHKLGLTPSNPQ